MDVKWQNATRNGLGSIKSRQARTVSTEEITGRPSISGQEAGTRAEPRSLIAWTEVIQQAWSRGADSTLELAKLMSRARECLAYGSWGRLWQSETLPFSRRKGEMLVVIGQELEGLNAQNSAQLPAAWNTLYYLARLGRTAVEQLIGQGRIYPKIGLRDARALLPKPHSESQEKDSCSRVKARLVRLGVLIRAESGSWPEAQRNLVRSQLLDLAQAITAGETANGAGSCKAPANLFNSQPLARFVNQPSLDCTAAAPLSQTPGTNQVSFTAITAI
jgi:hypothetical protein